MRHALRREQDGAGADSVLLVFNLYTVFALQDVEELILRAM
jgi:hypothetical protein